MPKAVPVAWSPEEVGEVHTFMYSDYTMNNTTPLALLLIACASAAPVASHSKLLQPPARTSPDPGTQNTLDGGGLNFDAPCGDPMDIPPSTPTATWTAGSDQTIVIDHRVFHGPEVYQLFVSYDGGSTFNEVSAPQLPAPGAVSYQTGGISSIGTGIISIHVGLPSDVGQAVLRYTDGEYFSCADITLQSGDPVFADGFETGDTTAWAPPTP